MAKYPFNNPQKQEVLDALDSGNDVQLLQHYWLIRVNQHDPYLTGAWARIQEIQAAEPERITSLYGKPFERQRSEDVARSANRQAVTETESSLPNESPNTSKSKGIFEGNDKPAIRLIGIDQSETLDLFGQTTSRATSKTTRTSPEVVSPQDTVLSTALQEKPNNTTAHTTASTTIPPYFGNNGKPKAGYQFTQPTEYDLEEAALKFVLETLAPNTPAVPSAIKVDGQIHRFQVDGDKDKAACYQFSKSGNGCTGWFRYWRVHQDSPVHWKFDFKAWNERNRPTKLDYADTQREHNQQQAQQLRQKVEALEKQQQQEQERDTAAINAAAEYNAASPCRGHKYLQIKRVPCVMGLRLDGRGNLLIPLYNENGTLCNLQRYVWSHQDGKYNRYYYTGAKRSGTFVVIIADKLGPLPTDLPPDTIIGICEGLATGLSAFEGIHDTSGIMVCAMDAPNLTPTALAVKKHYPNGKIYLFADNDWYTELRGKGNPGIKAARDAAHAIGLQTKHVLAPNFRVKDIWASDWNDFAAIHGIPAMVEAIKGKMMGRDINRQKERV